MGRGGAVVGGLSPLKKDEETKREKEPRGAVPESRGPGGGPGRPGRHRPTAAGGDDAFDLAARLGRRRALARRDARDVGSDPRRAVQRGLGELLRRARARAVERVHRQAEQTKLVG